MFGEYLRKLRESRGYKLRNFSKKIGIVASYLSDIERNCRKAPGDEILKKIEIALKLNVAESNKLRVLAINDKCNLPPDIVEKMKKHPEILGIIRKYY